ncbi:DUF1854 domain-containing protein [Caldivirga sp.]|uniref:DUF1854 domain-containing protein n=1 Tax=Caldivirga sp. TaxID=2080243 RepID=UPI003D0B2198
MASNLDVANEAEVFKAILNLTRGRTTIIITHNLPEVLASDRVIVMDKGNVVEEGPPMELVKRRGAFYELFKEQLELINPEAVAIAKNSDDGRVTLSDYIKDLVVDPSIIKVTPGSRRSLVNVNMNEVTLRDLRPRRPFPVTHPEYVILYDKDGEERLMLIDYRKLDEESRAAMEQAIAVNSLKPKVLRVKSIEIKGDEVDFNLVTDKGPVRVVVRGRRNIFTDDGKLHIIDVGNNIYEANLKALSQASLRAIMKTL